VVDVEEAKEGGGENWLGGVLLACGRGGRGGVPSLVENAGSGLNIFDGGFEVVDDVRFPRATSVTRNLTAGVFRGKPSGVVNLAAAGGIEAVRSRTSAGRGVSRLKWTGVEVVEE